MGQGQAMSGGARRRWIAVALIAAFVASACGGGDGDDGTSQGTIQGDTVVVDQDQLAEARAELEEEQEGEEPEIASASESGLDESSDTGDGDDEADEDEIEVAEAEEDELDGLLNAVTVFNQCLEDEGYEFMGAPGQDGANPDDFEQGYLQALGACAAESNIVASLQAFGEAQANLTPEEIAQNNFGLPTFKECLEGLGWTVAELVPDERGALGFGDAGTGLTPPEGTTALNLDDVQTCRLEAEAFVAENYVAEEAADG